MKLQYPICVIGQTTSMFTTMFSMLLTKCLVVLIPYQLCCLAQNTPQGHMQPFGSHRPPEGSIDQIDGWIHPKDFYHNYLTGGSSKPILFKGAAKDLPAFKLWTDEYLSEKYGQIEVTVEKGKKEDRSGDGKMISFTEFLNEYQRENIYMVQDLLPEMTGDVILPMPLRCGGFEKLLQLGVVWFSSGGTKSVLHNDDVDNINCILEGSKEIKFVDKKLHEFIEQDGFVFQGGYSKVDVEKVDLERYPAFSELEWWSAKMEKGDCLFIPHRWYHTVSSSNTRNLAVNLWFAHLNWFNQTDCDIKKEDLGKPVSLETLNHVLFPEDGSNEPEQGRSMIFMGFEGIEKITPEDAYKLWNEEKSPKEIQAIFHFIDQNQDGYITWEEIYECDISELLRNEEFGFMMVPDEGGHPMDEEPTIIEEHSRDEL